MPTRRLTYNKLGRNPRFGEDLMEARFPDNDSHMVFAYQRERGLILVFVVISRTKGDMKRMLDETVSQLGCTEVHFMEPLDHDIKSRVPELFDGDLTDIRDRLHDYEEYTFDIDNEPVTMVQTTWKLDDAS